MIVMLWDFGFKISISVKKFLGLSNLVYLGCRFEDAFGSSFVWLGGFYFDVGYILMLV